MKLIVDNVTLRINNTTILDGISLSAEQGVPHSIIGPNGSGKTSLLRVIAGIYKPTSGTVRIDGAGDPGSNIYYLPAEPSVFPGMKVIDYLQIALGLRGLYGEKSIGEIREVLAEFQVEGFLERDMSTLSSGERRLVYLAAVAATTRRIVIIDEPTTHLDLKWAITSMRLLLRHVRDKVFIYTTHDVNIASAFSEQTTVMLDGRVQASGNPRDVYSTELLGRVYGVDLAEFTDPRGRKFYVPST